MDLTAPLVSLLKQKPNQPLSTVSAVAAVFVPSSLLLFLTEPQLYRALDFPRLLLLSAAIGLPVLLLWFFAFYFPSAMLRARVLMLGVQPAGLSSFEALTGDLEWHALWQGGLAANVTLYGIAALAYFDPSLLLGSTLLLFSAIAAPTVLLLGGIGGFMAARRVIIEAIERGDFELREDSPQWLRVLFLTRAHRAQLNADETEPNWHSGILAGERVKHSKFGEGVATGVSHKQGRDHMLTIRLDSGERVMLDAPYTGIVRLAPPEGH